MALPKEVRIVEVGPRDGLQNENQFIPTEDKLAFIEALSQTGLKTIEATSFVSETKIPQLKDASAVYRGLNQSSGIDYPVLVPNLKGLEKAIDAGVKSISVFTSASNTFNQKNINCDTRESLKRIEAIIERAQSAKLRIRAYLSCCLGCPYEGEVPFDATAALAKSLLDLGAFEVSFGDTIGIGTAGKVNILMTELLERMPLHQIALHFHDTYGQALANIYAALQYGVAVFDSSVAGLGGCPYAKGATGNVATEDVLFLMQGLTIETGIELERLAAVGQSFCQKHGLTNHSKVGYALAAKSNH